MLVRQFKQVRGGRRRMLEVIRLDLLVSHLEGGWF
jgi:hypothetical protein